jgi:hypothetical protein
MFPRFSRGAVDIRESPAWCRSTEGLQGVLEVAFRQIVVIRNATMMTAVTMAFAEACKEIGACKFPEAAG